MTELIDLVLETLVELSEDEQSSTAESVDSSSEEDVLLLGQIVERKNIRRMNAYMENVVRFYADDIFQTHFRIGRVVVYKLIDLLAQANVLPSHLHGREKITAEKAFLLTLWYLSNQETFRQISDRFNVTRSSAHRTLKRVLEFIFSLKTKHIKWPTGDKIAEINNGFKNMQGIDNIIGVIDGSHIEIGKPKDNQDAYINRKGYHSLLLQGIVDHKKKFIDVFCGEPGSMHDARLLRKSGIYNNICNGVIVLGDNYILGDTAYPNLPWLVTPFKDNGRLSANEKVFNYRISSTRVVVENAFGLLKGRFRRLKKMDNIDLKMCSKIIMAACILHNICISENNYIETDLSDFNQPECHNAAFVDENVNRRQAIMLRMFNR